MSQVVDRLAELTGYRDRGVLDQTLVGALLEMLRARSIAIYRCVGDAPAERWLTRARQAAGEPVASADPLWVELETLPALHEKPVRERCYRTARMQCEQGEVTTTCFPVATDRDVVGVLEVESDAPLSGDGEQLVAGVLRIYGNFLGLLDSSERDTLTGLLNRKTFDDACLRGAAQVVAPSSAVQDDSAERRAGVTSMPWLGVIDIDHFKLVNDNYGHLIGDEVLLLMSRLMRSCFRLHDQLFRFGGEEFVVLLRAGTDADAGVAFERLRKAVEDYGFPQVGRITVCVGYTQLRRGDSPADAFERADRAIYYAKQNGRNRVASYQALLAKGVFSEEERDSDVELF